MDRLRSGWKEVAEGVIGLKKLVQPSEQETDAEDSARRKLDNDR